MFLLRHLFNICGSLQCQLFVTIRGKAIPLSFEDGGLFSFMVTWQVAEREWECEKEREREVNNM